MIIVRSFSGCNDAKGRGHVRQRRGHVRGALALMVGTLGLMVGALALIVPQGARPEAWTPQKWRPGQAPPE